MSSNDLTTAPAALLARSRGRYAASDQQLAALADAALARARSRPLAGDQDRVIAAHVAMAALCGAHLSPAPGRVPLSAAGRGVSAAEPAERALAEHLHARLPEEVLAAVTLRATCAVPARAAAEALHVTVPELRRLEAIAREDAEALTLPYHDDHICEPADLASLASSTAVTEAVRDHLARCRSCRREFHQRVWHVLGVAGAMTADAPPLHVAGRSPTGRVRTALARPRTAAARRLP